MLNKNWQYTYTSQLCRSLADRALYSAEPLERKVCGRFARILDSRILNNQERSFLRSRTSRIGRNIFPDVLVTQPRDQEKYYDTLVPGRMVARGTTIVSPSFVERLELRIWRITETQSRAGETASRWRKKNHPRRGVGTRLKVYATRRKEN